MEPTIGVDWPKGNSFKQVGRVRADRLRLVIRPYNESGDLIFRFNRAAVLIELCHTEKMYNVDLLHKIPGCTFREGYSSQLIGEIVRELLGLPGVYPPVGAMKARSPIYGKKWIPVLGGELTLERGKNDIQITYRDEPTRQEIKEMLLAAALEELPQPEEERLANRLRIMNWNDVQELLFDTEKSLKKMGRLENKGLNELMRQKDTDITLVLRQRKVVQYAPQQLPPPPSPFIERVGDLRWLRERSPESGVLLAGLRGMGGGGKSTLAVFLAHEWKVRFPDGQLYLTISRTSDYSPESIETQTREQLRNAIRAFKIQPPVSDDLGELTSAYRDVLATRHALVVLDNAQDHAQITSFIPPEGCGLIATSRQDFSLGKTPARLIGRMDGKEAAQLLKELYPPLTEDQLQSLVCLCAGSPLALRIVGGALAMEAEERGDVADVAAAINRLGSGERLTVLDAASEGVVAETVTQTLRLSEAGLTEEEKLVWWTLGVFPDDFDDRAAFVVTGAAWEVLERLVRRNLVERSKAGYRLHDLVRDYTSACLYSDTPRHYQACFDHATHYEQTLKEKSFEYLRGGDEMMASLSWFDREWNNIKEGQRWARENREASRNVADLCLDFPIGASNFLRRRIHPHTEISWLQTALNVYKGIKHPDKTYKQKGAKILHNLALEHSQLGEMEEACRFYEQSLRLITGLKQPTLDLEANARANLGWALYKLKFNAGALLQYKASLRAAERIRDNRKRVIARAGALQNLGIYYKSKKKYDAALRCYNEVIKEAVSLQDLLTQAKTLGNIGIVVHLQGDAVAAIEHFQHQLAISKSLNDTEGQASAQYNEALATYDLENTPEKIQRAIFLTSEALRLYKSIGHPMVADAEYNLRELQEILSKE